MLLGLSRGVGDATCLGVYPEPSLPKKPMAGKGSLCFVKFVSNAFSTSGLRSFKSCATLSSRARARDVEGINLPVPGCGFQRPHHVLRGQPGGNLVTLEVPTSSTSDGGWNERQVWVDRDGGTTGTMNRTDLGKDLDRGRWVEDKSRIRPNESTGRTSGQTLSCDLSCDEGNAFHEFVPSGG